MRSSARVEAFLEMMSAERGASDNTLQSYRRDLEDAAERLPVGHRRGRRGRPARLSRRHRRPRLCVELAGAQALDAAAVLQIPLRRGAARGRPDRHARQPAQGPLAAEDHERGRDRPAARPRRRGSRARRRRRRRRACRAAPACAGRAALRDRPARLRAGFAAGHRGAARRPLLRGPRQGRQGTHGAAVREGAEGDARLARASATAIPGMPTAAGCFRPPPKAAICRARFLRAT